jgi:hypothetical protein
VWRGAPSTTVGVAKRMPNNPLVLDASMVTPQATVSASAGVGVQ